MITDSSYYEVTADEITATDLRDEIEVCRERGEVVTCYRIRFCVNDRRQPEAEQGQMVYCAEAGRAGIAWGADAVWTDCEGAEDAISRYARGEMIE